MRMKMYIFGINLFSLLFFVECSIERKEQTNPNIIIIYADDMGYGDAQCYNSKSLIPTPNIDQLASEGALFTDAHSTSSVCTPSRYSLLTGRYCWRTSLTKHVLWPWEKPLIKKERLTLPEMLREKGYQTGAIGKWHLGWNWPTHDSLAAKIENGNNVDYSMSITGGPIEHGFDYYFGDDVPNFPPYTFIENDKVTVKPTIVKPDSLFGDNGKMADGWKLEAVMPIIAKKAISYINEKSLSEKPFFLYFPLTAPHTPIAPAEQFKGKSKAGLYGDYVCEVDWVVGQIIKALEKNDIAENTIVIFTSDNGSPGKDGTNWSGEIGSVKAYGHLPNGSLRGYKGDIWEAGHRIPFIVRWPEKVKNGMSSDELICQVDIMRTIASIIGYQLPENAGEDSYNILPALIQENNKPIRETLVHHSWNGSFAIRKGKWKLILTEKSGGFGDKNHEDEIGSAPPGQLYNIENDIEEQNNLYKQYPEIVEGLQLLLGKYIREGRSTPGTMQHAAMANDKPNVVFILIDDMGWKDISCMGSQYYRTPNIDRLASEGMLFTQAYSSSPNCSPSRGAIFSGQYPARTGMTTVFSAAAVQSDSLRQVAYDKKSTPGIQTQGPAFRWCLHADQITFAEVLQETGYKTGYLGKWHYGWEPSQWPDKQGFELAEGYRTTPSFTKGHWGKDYIPPLGAELPGLTEDEYMSEALTRRAEDFITQNKQNPFLLVISHYLVHLPLQAQQDKLERWKEIPTNDQDNPIMAAMIESIDESVGRILASLKKNELENNTVVIFTSDNGGYHGATSTYPMLGSKGMPYEGGYRVPFIVKWPGHIRGGEKEVMPTMQIDLYPTILALTGTAPDPKQRLDGESLLSVLTGGRTIKDRPIYFHFPHYSDFGCSPFTAIRYKDWKLYRYYNDSGGAHHLFDLKHDPNEQADLSQAKPEKVRQLLTMLDNWIVEIDASLPVPNPEYDPEAIQEFVRDYTYGQSIRIRNEQEVKIKTNKK